MSRNRIPDGCCFSTDGCCANDDDDEEEECAEEGEKLLWAVLNLALDWFMADSCASRSFVAVTGFM